MKQTRLASLFETFGGTAVGFVLALGGQYAVCWWYDLPLRAADNISIVLFFTALSLIRGYGWRRLCEAIHVRRPLSPAMQAVIAERFGQAEREGFDHAHDDAHEAGELGAAGASYALAARAWLEHPMTSHPFPPPMPGMWPWAREWWKPRDFRRDLVRAAALILAEIEKFDRAKRRRRG